MTPSSFFLEEYELPCDQTQICEMDAATAIGARVGEVGTRT